ncbi:hypothetical protein H6G81_11640 [Scytonema hofmannii FACHB-248]|uniref:Transposase n=1 Tax=Scytonema hofmannii FACHB-248 TaxID=1842502 RepID=A0ABR8GPL4_9CYAN|nr:MULTISPECIES: hypothetical protein [Nostocales]MBD2605167.1 hypothetical protein [Scytonema hofmannii FACHB-248]
MTLYKNKYRIETVRCSKWDYTSDGYYFITICTHNRQFFFGEIIDGEMQLSQIGEIIAEEWQKTSQIRSNVQLDAWVIMPNHRERQRAEGRRQKECISVLCPRLKGVRV